MKRLIGFLLVLSVLCGPAFAGDFATRNILGFSQDGSLFAFEEYGVQDGSGFPYASIYVIDTASDRWVSGAPFHARIDDETASLADARQLARQMASAALDPITEPGTINATNQPLEVVDNPMRMTARPFHFVPPTNERIEFRLEAIPFVGQPVCEAFGETYGFRLLSIGLRDGEATRVLHEDQSIPKSRGCPLSYRFADIVTYRPQGASKLATAILILYETVGFEGPDGRYLAVTFTTSTN